MTYIQTDRQTDRQADRQTDIEWNAKFRIRHWEKNNKMKRILFQETP